MPSPPFSNALGAYEPPPWAPGVPANLDVPLPSSPQQLKIFHDYPIQLWSAWDVPSAQVALDAHVLGQFYQSGLLAEAMSMDDAFDAVMHTRVLGLLSREQRWEAPKTGNKVLARKAHRALTSRWSSIATDSAVGSVLRSGLHMGFGIAQIIWAYEDGLWFPKELQPWHPSLTYYNFLTRTFIVNTQEGPEHVVPGTGQWILYTPYGSYRGWVNASVRAVCYPFLARQYALRDWSRYSEVHGLPLKKAFVPASAESADKQNFEQAIANLANETTVMLPRGVDAAPGSSYDIELLEAKAQSWEAFEGLISKCETRMAIRILGQNLTTDVNAGSLAAANVHDRVRLDYVRGDAKSMSDCLRDQLVAPFCRFNFGADDIAPTPTWDVKPPEDLSVKARAISEVSVAAQNFANAQAPVDQRKLLESVQVPVLPEGVKPPPPPDPGVKPQSPGGVGPRNSTARASLSTHHARHALAGQVYVDGVADAGRDRAAKALRPHLRAIQAAIQAATDYDDLRARLKRVLKGSNRKHLARVVARALAMGELAGRHSVNEESKR